MSNDALPSSEDRFQFAAWDELGAGAPTVVALAALCSQAMISGRVPPDSLSLHARSILFAARDRGVLEIKGTYDAFAATARLLAVSVEKDEERSIVFLAPDDPELTVRFLDGFRELCSGGLVMHHLYREFSLTSRGFDWARRIKEEEVEPLLKQIPYDLNNPPV